MKTNFVNGLNPGVMYKDVNYDYPNFHDKNLTLCLASTMRHKATRKWPIEFTSKGNEGRNDYVTMFMLHLPLTV